MRWRGQRESSNIEDRRGLPIPGGAGGLGIGTVIVAFVAAWFLGIDPGVLLGMLSGAGGPPTQSEQVAPGANGAPTDDEGRFASVVLASTEDVWSGIFRQSNTTYRPPRLVLFEQRVDTACGLAGAASGPFYCPGDQRLYIDLSFFRVLSQRLGAQGDFARAYVIAHEVGHHVQNLEGTMDQLQRARQQVSETQYNALSVRVELQADCYAGVWANHAQQARQWLEAGDIEEGINAAAAVGDDRLQRQMQGTVVPETFTHGSSAQRVRWFRTGLDSGDPKACNTFGRG
ncbi:MAG: neutral zinc metallopeptidase [Burkholderiaceae bacterium]|jgi:predicted metalloprotease|nr:neutral zinc metallopeptidase [Burkholderiaceae bacterium]